jgi:hypothetical protein
MCCLIYCDRVRPKIVHSEAMNAILKRSRAAAFIQKEIDRSIRSYETSPSKIAESYSARVNLAFGVKKWNAIDGKFNQKNCTPPTKTETIRTKRWQVPCCAEELCLCLEGQ